MAKMLITVEEAKNYARIDGDYDDDVIESLILFAEGYINGALGDDFPREDPRIKLVAKAIVAEMYDNREFTASNTKMSNSVRHLCSSTFLQIQMEMRTEKWKQATTMPE